MVLALEKKGFIARGPIEARSIRLLLPRDRLPTANVVDRCRCRSATSKLSVVGREFTRKGFGMNQGSTSAAVPDRGHLTTEQPNAASAELDRLDIGGAVDVIQREDAGIAGAVAAQRGSIVAAIELVVASFRAGGRLIYVGAGTSGRLGVLDASECPPTYCTPPDQVQAVIAGGPGAMFRSAEGAEDDPEAGAAEMDRLGVGPNDTVFGIAAGGTTPYVHGALGRAKARSARTVFLACVAGEASAADVCIRVLVGPEVVTGSTRMKAGTATKMVLNTVTTVAMVQMGKVYGNLMVDLKASNVKLRDRAGRIIARITGLDREHSMELLDRAGGKVKTAIVMHVRNGSRWESEKYLEERDGRLSELRPITPAGVEVRPSQA